jgi:Predicted esterase
MDVHTLQARTHGRYLIEPGPDSRLLVGCHGYAENAERCLAELLRIPGIGEWTLVSVQALHRFYQSRTGDVVASWMTGQDRELAIADNLAYVEAVLNELPPAPTKVFLGFSQGAAMAYRAGAAVAGASAILALGGDVPPDVTGLIPPVLIGRGKRDEWYTSEKLEKDLRFLEGRATVSVCEFDGGHEWSDPFREAAAEVLRSLL